MTPRSTVLLRLWGAILIAAALVMGPLPLFTFGAIAFAGLFVFWLKGGRQRPRWALEAGKDPHVHLVYGALMLLCVVWFVMNLMVELAGLIPSWNQERLMVILMAIAFVFAPLIMQGQLIEARGGAKGMPFVKVCVGLVYVLAFLSSLCLLLAAAGIVSYSGLWISLGAPLFLVALIISAASFGALLHSEPASRRTTAQPRQPPYWGATLVSVAVASVIIISSVRSGELTKLAEWLSVVMRSLPLLMLFLASYYERRFEFFDVFVKKSTLFFVLLLLLFSYFSLIPPLWAQRVPQEMLVWVYSLTLLPVVFALPWLFARIEVWLDRVWLGRKYTTAEAVRAFLDGIPKVTTSVELVAHTESRLREIFQASARVLLDGAAAAAEADVAETVAIPAYGHTGGTIQMGPRANQTPYFRQDLTLLKALAEVFSYMMANLQLQERKKEQEQREQELILNASRSELKALRAQINPHFLFNALNTIAGLIPSQPERAESTVEQLAEVFRYTLSRSEAEWARIEDELEFVGSYLEVEKARFGDRLQVSVEADAGLRDEHIPTMMIQTLVENAVKHGLGAVKGEGRIGIRVNRVEGQIEISVTDNGPGPLTQPSRGAGGRERKGVGYGLKNISSRLEGYYGDQACVELTRDETRGLTLAILRLPMGHRETG